MRNFYLIIPLTLASLIPTSMAGEISLFEEMKSLDNALFESFNHCQNPSQLKRHASFFSSNVEFYHDNGGVTWDRGTMIKRTKKNVCGHYARKLVAD
ncbi:MAG: hypothetical protein Q9M92_05590 [Enterobacterales bacterium]|nr:hypothetical protein [Enterobacterales bacterium]